MAEISGKELKKQLNKKQFDNIYLIYGDEKMYVKINTKLLTNKLIGEEPPEFNYHKFDQDYDLDAIAVAVQVAPFMSEYNVVIISDLDVSDIKNFPSESLERLISIMDNLPDTTVLIMTMPTLKQDLKKPGAAFEKLKSYIAKKGTVCLEGRETDISLARQIVRWADSRGKKIEQADAYKLQEYAGYDLNTIRNELDKICNYLGNDEIITTAHIEMLVTKRLEANIFSLTDAIVALNSDRAFSILDILFYQKASANDIVSVISMSYIDFYRARVALESGTSISQTAKDFGYGKRKFAIEKAGQKTRNIPTSMLRKSLAEIAETTAKLRSVSANDRILIERLVAKLIIYAGERV